VSPSLSFRRRIQEEESGAAKGAIHSPPFLPEIYGAKNEEPAVQVIGNIRLREGRVVLWPNVFQTRLLPFSIDDPSKPGHMRCLMLHLIDPNRRMMSTAMVPCQRRDWWAREIRTRCPRLWRLPQEVFDLVIEHVDNYPISIEEGQRTRDEFRAEREAFRERHTKAFLDLSVWDFYGEPGAEDLSESGSK
jgi:hypothetical protein